MVIYTLLRILVNTHQMCFSGNDVTFGVPRSSADHCRLPWLLREPLVQYIASS